MIGIAAEAATPVRISASGKASVNSNGAVVLPVTMEAPSCSSLYVSNAPKYMYFAVKRRIEASRLSEYLGSVISVAYTLSIRLNGLPLPTSASPDRTALIVSTSGDESNIEVGCLSLDQGLII